MRPIVRLVTLAVLLAFLPYAGASWGVPEDGGAVERMIEGSPAGDEYRALKAAVPCLDGTSITECLGTTSVHSNLVCILTRGEVCQDADPWARSLGCILKDPLHNWCD